MVPVAMLSGITDCVVGFIEVEFLLLTVISVISENSSGVTVAMV